MPRTVRKCRSDGWTPAARAIFLAALANNGNVATAAAAVGRTVSTAYRLRRNPAESAFAAAARPNDAELNLAALGTSVSNFRASALDDRQLIDLMQRGDREKHDGCVK